MISHIVSTFSGKPIFGYFSYYFNQYLKILVVQDSPYNISTSKHCYVTHYMREKNYNLYCTRVTLMATSLIILYYVVTYSVIINIELFNPQEINALSCNNSFIGLSLLVRSSETTRVFSTDHSLPPPLFKKIKEEGGLQYNVELKNRQWIAGLIDGDGYFGVSKKNYCSLEIVVEPRDIACLMKVKNRYGGSVKSTSHADAVRYRLHHNEGIKQVINDLNGLFYNPTRINQFQKICILHNIKYIEPMPLDYNSRYLAGLFDSDGSIYLNIKSQQVFITISQKSRVLLDIVSSVYGGTVYSANASNTAFKWTVSRKSDNLNLINNYFHWNGCVSAKNKRFGMVKEFYRLSSIGATKATIDSPLGESLLKFKENWDKYNINNND